MARTFARPDGRIDYVRNRSSRRGVRPKLVVIHTTESHDRPGRTDVDAVHGWFDNPRSSASSHVIVDAEGHSTTCVPDVEKAWTQANYNPHCLSIELIGFAALKRWQWLKRERQLKKAAKFTAHWCLKHSIPAARGKVSPNVVSVQRPGIIGHSEMGGAGGGHHDPGPDFPWDRFMRYVHYYRRHGWRK